MSASKDQEFYQTCLDKLNEATDIDVCNELIESIETDFATEKDEINNIRGDGKNKSAIIIDGDGKYYYQTSEKIVKVEPLSKVSTNPAKTLDSTLVPQANKRKNKGTSACTKNSKLLPSTSKTVKNEKILVKSIKEKITSEDPNEEEIYEFDENEQDPDDPCEKTDYESKSIVKNAKKSTDSEKFSCMICLYETTKKFLLSRHLKTHTEERPHKCSVCERGFKTKASLMNHRNTHLGIKPHACKDCDMAFTTSGELTRHVRYRHTHIKPHKCTECDYSSVEMSKLRRHMCCHTGERPYQCPHCTYASPDTFKLKRHMRIHTGEKPYVCDICQARFTQSNSLKHHRLIHSVNEKPVFQCHLCPTTCGRKTDLRLHIKKLHNSDQPLPCKRCGKELPDRYSYKVHIKTHQGEKCYRCEYCPYASITKRQLESHIFIHKDSKPFVCEICQNSFRQKALLSRHMNFYHSNNYKPPQPRRKDHKCPHCNKMFAFNGNLIRHMEIHDPTSRLFEEQRELKMGRMRRVLEDGTVVLVEPLNALSKNLKNNAEYRYEETKEVEQLIDVDDEEYQEEEYDEEEEEYNEENVQYLYDEIDGDEYAEERDYCEVEEKDYHEQESKNVINVKVEKLETVVASQPAQEYPISVKAENKEKLSLELHDDHGFMIIEVLPTEDDEPQQQEKVHNQIQFQQRNKSVSNKKTNNAKSIKTKKAVQPLISDYFGFEENEDEETKCAIKLLEMIEQE